MTLCQKELCYFSFSYPGVPSDEVANEVMRKHDFVESGLWILSALNIESQSEERKQS